MLTARGTGPGGSLGAVAPPRLLQGEELETRAEGPGSPVVSLPGLSTDVQAANSSLPRLAQVGSGLICQWRGLSTAVLTMSARPSPSCPGAGTRDSGARHRAGIRPRMFQCSLPIR